MTPFDEAVSTVLSSLYPRWTLPPHLQFKAHSEPYGDPCHLKYGRFIRVFVNEHDTDGVRLYAAIVHGCCHARKSKSHGAGWTKDMEATAKRADRVGWAAVAVAIRDEILRYSERSEFRDVYAMARRMVHLHKRTPSWSFDTIHGMLQQEAGLRRSRSEKGLNDERLKDLFEKLLAADQSRGA